MRQTSTPLTHRQVQIQDHQVRRPVGHRLERRVAAADDLDLGVTVALERVLDESGDVFLVLDDQDAMFWHNWYPHRSVSTFRVRVAAVKCGLREGLCCWHRLVRFRPVSLRLLAWPPFPYLFVLRKGDARDWKDQNFKPDGTVTGP